ncbi:hypothetical protein AB1L07_05175 [Niallia alba]|uniref:hypothetical protein n=1 Tax=Niallia alba TaxID=2729105 RepID=UPI0039A06BED
MEYYRKTPRSFLIIMLALVTVSLSLSLSSPVWLLFFQLTLILFFILSFFIQYKITITDEVISYQIQCIGTSLYKKKIQFSQIMQISFKRFGWSTKGAIIKQKKGFSIQIIHYSPNNILEDLMFFANRNGIMVIKTKDFLILE